MDALVSHCPLKRRIAFLVSWRRLGAIGGVQVRNRSSDMRRCNLVIDTRGNLIVSVVRGVDAIGTDTF
jgi:hypothetical protein